VLGDRELGHVGTVQQALPLGGVIEEPSVVEERRLPGAAGADDRDELSRLDREVNSVERHHRLAASARVPLGHAAELDAIHRDDGSRSRRPRPPRRRRARRCRSLRASRRRRIPPPPPSPESGSATVSVSVYRTPRSVYAIRIGTSSATEAFTAVRRSKATKSPAPTLPTKYSRPAGVGSTPSAPATTTTTL